MEITKGSIVEMDELTYKVIGCAMKVHNTLGNGFQEVIYQRCLSIELRKEGIKFVREVEQTIYYDGVAVRTRRADFVIDGKLTLEIKATINLEPVHLNQAKNYVVSYDFPSAYSLISDQIACNAKNYSIQNIAMY